MVHIESNSNRWLFEIDSSPKDQSKSFHPASRHFFTNRFTSCERARVVTSNVSGMSTITRSSTPKQAINLPEPGTTMPPATCSVSTGSSASATSRKRTREDQLPRLLLPRMRGWLDSAGRRSASDEKSPTSSQPAIASRQYVRGVLEVIDIPTERGRHNGYSSFQSRRFRDGIVDGNTFQTRPDFA